MTSRRKKPSTKQPSVTKYQTQNVNNTEDEKSQLLVIEKEDILLVRDTKVAAPSYSQASGTRSEVRTVSYHLGLVSCCPGS